MIRENFTRLTVFFFPTFLTVKTVISEMAEVHFWHVQL